MHGYAGKVLRVDLTDSRISTEPLNQQWARDFVGGRGLATKYLYESLDPTVEALSPANVLVLASGPITGTNGPSAARYMVVTKSPLTGAITHSNSGGHWAPELKFAGYDLVIVHGRASKPVYLWVFDDEVELRDASHLWGKGTWETEDAIRSELAQPDAIIAGIGPAGEKLVRFACIINDKHRAAGRSGVGAVMGSKNLKAIAVRGTKGVSVARPREFCEAVWHVKQKMAESAGIQGLGEFGTAATIDLINAAGALPTRNHQQGQFEKSDDINGNAINDKWLVRNKACFACTIACGRITHLPGDGATKYLVNTHPRNWKMHGEGPEYENLWSLGADCGVGDMDAIIKANWMCNDLGMDPISCGSTIAAAMELYERGIIKDDELPPGGGDIPIPLRFGNGEALVRLTEAIAYREGIGDKLAEGSKRLGAMYDHPEVHMGSKGQEFPAYDPRGVVGMGVAYATCNRGACHIRAWTPAVEILGDMDPKVADGKAAWVIGSQHETTWLDATGCCLFITSGMTFDDLVPILNHAVGANYTKADLDQVGERIWNLERLFNLHAGLTRADDSLPKRLLETPFESGPSKGVVVPLEAMLNDYYNLRGWTPAGEPTAAKLADLGLAG